MHSRIFQVSEEPISKSDWVDESYFYDGFVGRYADYTADVSDNEREGSIQWLVDISNGGFEREGDAITVVDKKKLFEKDFENYRGHLEEIQSKLSLDSFSDNSMEMDMFRLQSVYDDEGGMYVCDNDGYYETLGHYVRRLHDGETFYIGAVIDYHM